MFIPISSGSITIYVSVILSICSFETRFFYFFTVLYSTVNPYGLEEKKEREWEGEGRKRLEEEMKLVSSRAAARTFWKVRVNAEWRSHEADWTRVKVIGWLTSPLHDNSELNTVWTELN